jgi:hypothetical protein
MHESKYEQLFSSFCNFKVAQNRLLLTWSYEKQLLKCRFNNINIFETRAFIWDIGRKLTSYTFWTHFQVFKQYCLCCSCSLKIITPGFNLIVSPVILNRGYRRVSIYTSHLLYTNLQQEIQWCIGGLRKKLNG